MLDLLDECSEGAIVRPAVFLDRDGVIIENRSDYIKSWADVRFLPDALEALRQLSRLEHALVIVTNQSVVGRGIISLEQAVEINRQVIAAIEAHEGRVDACYLCPHRRMSGAGVESRRPGWCFRRGRILDWA